MDIAHLHFLVAEADQCPAPELVVDMLGKLGASQVIRSTGRSFRPCGF